MKQKRYHIVVASIVFAILMWVSVNMGYEYTVTRRIPVVIENLKEGKALRFPVPKYVTVRFKGLGWYLAGLYFLPDVKYFIDVSSLTSDQFVIVGHDLQDHVKLPVAVQAVDVKPDTMHLALDDYAERRVPIAPHLLLNYREGYGQVGPLHVQPESVLVGGAREIVDHAVQWPTVFQRFDNLTAPVNAEIALEEAADFSIEPLQSSARVIVGVQPFAEKTLAGIPIRASAVPGNREIIFMPPKMDVTVRGGVEQLARLSPADFQAMVDYQALLQDSTGVITPLLSVPPEVRVLNRRPEHVEFYIRKRL
jgi:hypothetical protein